MSKIAIITSNDFVSRTMIADVLSRIENHDELILIYDHSSSLKRIYKLIQKKRINPSWLILGFLSRLLQSLSLRFDPDYKTAANSIITFNIKSNADLADYLDNNKEIKSIYCFRAGLVINKQNVTKAKFINIHCAKIPEYAGLMSISRALHNKDYEQFCTMHHVIEAIDSGEILKTAPYTLDPKKLYWQNELNAYKVGAKLLADVLVKEV